MFAAFLEDTAVWQPLLRHPVLLESLDWLSRNAANAGFGDHQLGAEGWYVNIHGYATTFEADCRWENHPRTVDVQYLISGCEGIRWQAAGLLGPADRYREEHDRQEFDAPAADGSLITMLPGSFAIFLPGDAHCPKIALRGSEQLRKAVVKIPIRLLAE